MLLPARVEGKFEALQASYSSSRAGAAWRLSYGSGSADEGRRQEVPPPGPTLATATSVSRPQLTPPVHDSYYGANIELLAASLLGLLSLTPMYVSSPCLSSRLS